MPTNMDPMSPEAALLNDDAAKAPSQTELHDRRDVRRLMWEFVGGDRLIDEADLLHALNQGNTQVRFTILRQKMLTWAANNMPPNAFLPIGTAEQLEEAARYFNATGSEIYAVKRTRDELGITPWEPAPYEPRDRRTYD